MIVNNLQHNMVTIFGASLTVPAASPLGIEVPPCDGAWIQVYGDSVAVTFDGREPVVGSVGKALVAGDTLLVAPEDVQFMKAATNGVSHFDIDFLSARG
jgi:hypothetical protein